ncbi:hypothetical protein THARTR1_05940 [Trichoderma harzianum]|uniref:SCP domain-containing protein n=1 Tax=Trichoderma harzianum TaxID=5544 RepID=A0A2K0U7S3_TRIHA|nr:hypothetical protein THARTR1_05940 [Trichoderma harzianum]
MHLFLVIQWLIPFIGLCLAQADDRALALSLINQARQAQGIQPLVWNANLASYAQYWANIMAAGQQPFSHAQGTYRPQQGETLFEYQSTQCDAAYDNPLQTAAHTWLAQASLYNGMPITDGHEPWLHWSQCMWSTTTQIGCARAYSISEPYKTYDVCRFFPEGNM